LVRRTHRHFLPPGKSVEDLAFDGDHVWVSSSLGTLTKLRASDGANLGTFTVGTDARGIAFDGANIWVSNGSSNTVTKVRASDGAVLSVFPVANTPSAVAFDGTNVWVINQFGGGSQFATKLRASDGAFQGVNDHVNRTGCDHVKLTRGLVVQSVK
jgi:hypothetical protein